MVKATFKSRSAITGLIPALADSDVNQPKTKSMSLTKTSCRKRSFSLISSGKLSTSAFLNSNCLQGSRKVYELEVRNQAEALEKQLRRGSYRDSLVVTQHIYIHYTGLHNNSNVHLASLLCHCKLGLSGKQ